MREQIRSNRIRSVVLVVGMGLLLLLLGYFLGLAFVDSGIGGLAIALAIWVIMSLVAYFQGSCKRSIFHKLHKTLQIISFQSLFYRYSVVLTEGKNELPKFRNRARFRSAR